jgi:hypothetical protein
MSEKEESVKSQEVLLKRVDKLESLLMQVAKVLAYNTQYATMVTTPMLRNKQIKFIQLSQVDEEKLVAVIVVGDNIAKNKTNICVLTVLSETSLFSSYFILFMIAIVPFKNVFPKTFACLDFPIFCNPLNACAKMFLNGTR